MPGSVPPFETVSREMAEVLRAKTGAERLGIAFGMYRSARRMLRSHLGSQHPDWSEEQLDAEVARRIASGSG